MKLTSLATAILPATALFLTGRSFGAQLSAQQPLPSLLIVVRATNSSADLPIVWQIPTSEDVPAAAVGLGSLKLRGSSSKPNPKQPYKFEIQDPTGNDQKASLLAMLPESDWILYPSFTDKTFVRDVLAYDLWREMGYYAPRWRYIEMYISTNSVLPDTNTTSEPSVLHASGPSSPSVEDLLLDTNAYHGIYILLEKIKRGKHRVNIQKLPRGSPPTDNGQLTTVSEPLTSDRRSPTSDLSGGYIFKKDRLNPGEKGFISSAGMNFAYEEPKERDITRAQQQWLTNHINEFEAALFGEIFTDPERGYAKYIDVDSFIDYHWIVEMSRNIDAFFVSWFFHKDRGGKIKAGPIWDWDFGFGNTAIGFKTNGWVADTVKRGAHYRWYERLFQDPDFLQRYIDRWSELRANIFATSNILARIDARAAQIEPHADRNYQRWPYLDQRVSSTYFTGKTYRSHVDYLKQWIIGRLAWIDSQDFPKPVLQVIPPLLPLRHPRFLPLKKIPRSPFWIPSCIHPTIHRSTHPFCRCPASPAPAPSSTPPTTPTPASPAATPPPTPSITPLQFPSLPASRSAPAS